MLAEWGPLDVEDTGTPVTDRPQAHEDEVKFILEAISEYLTVKVRRSDVLSTWAGLRPLASDPNAADTESASRDHIVTRDPDGLLTVTGISHNDPQRNHTRKGGTTVGAEDDQLPISWVPHFQAQLL